MINDVFIVFSIISIFASLVALLVLIFGSFQKKEKKQDDEETAFQFVKRESRTIKINKADENQLRKKKEGLNTQISSLLSVVVIGQFVGIYFLLVFLEKTSKVHTVIQTNAIILIIASMICSFLTLLNGWLKIKMEILYRLLFQGYSIIVAAVLFCIGVEKGITIQSALTSIGFIADFIIIVYFSTVILALALMLLDGVYRKHERVDFNFNNYFIIVIGIGMGVGLSLLLILTIMQRS